MISALHDAKVTMPDVRFMEGSHPQAGYMQLWTLASHPRLEVKPSQAEVKRPPTVPCFWASALFTLLTSQSISFFSVCGDFRAKESQVGQPGLKSLNCKSGDQLLGLREASERARAGASAENNSEAPAIRWPMVSG